MSYKNKEDEKKNSKQYRLKNKEKIKVYMRGYGKQYYLDNKENIMEYWSKNKEHIPAEENLKKHTKLYEPFQPALAM